MTAVPAYPLAWPEGWPRTVARGVSPFKQDRDKAIRHLETEITRLGGRDPVLSTNLKRNMSGGIHGQQAEPADPGVAVYFTLKERQMVFACDRYRTVRDNIHAVGLTIEAIRGISRWGASDMMERAFRGFEALPPPRLPQDRWREILGYRVNDPVTAEDVAARYRRIAADRHPDTGGSNDAMAELNAARDAALAAVRVRGAG